MTSSLAYQAGVVCMCATYLDKHQVLQLKRETGLEAWNTWGIGCLMETGLRNEQGDDWQSYSSRGVSMLVCKKQFVPAHRHPVPFFLLNSLLSDFTGWNWPG